MNKPIHQIFAFDPKEYVPPCEDYTEFQSYIRDSRRVADDTLVFTINRSDGSPKECEAIYKTLQQIHQFRIDNISRCLQFYEDRLNLSQTESSGKERPNSITNIKRGKQVNNFDRKAVAFLKSERGVEEILKEQSSKILKAKRDINKRGRGHSRRGQLKPGVRVFDHSRIRVRGTEAQGLSKDKNAEPHRALC
ncbi:coiled-coil domain-containing protein [Planoprotostelium fungivorum]|uniref:Coiled-coil domain-containing protein n=1 Tax=Planoprotostelium fungivorum TaxID=1890364 RepID=A0A2P6NWF2_9EUKA|nr:coiled-coil domain-containing protein [Planoprotostelium fungivorum]